MQSQLSGLKVGFIYGECWHSLGRTLGTRLTPAMVVRWLTVLEERKRVGAKMRARLYVSILFSWWAATKVSSSRRCCRTTRWEGGRRSISSCRQRVVEAGDERAVGGGDYSYPGLPCELKESRG